MYERYVSALSAYRSSEHLFLIYMKAHAITRELVSKQQQILRRPLPVGPLRRDVAVEVLQLVRPWEPAHHNNLPLQRERLDPQAVRLGHDGPAADGQEEPGRNLS